MFFKRTCKGALNKYVRDYDSFLNLVIVGPLLSRHSMRGGYGAWIAIWGGWKF